MKPYFTLNESSFSACGARAVAPVWRAPMTTLPMGCGSVHSADLDPSVRVALSMSGQRPARGTAQVIGFPESGAIEPYILHSGTGISCTQKPGNATRWIAKR